MFVDDMGIKLAKRGGLIDRLPRKRILGLGRVPDRCGYNEGCGVTFAVSVAGFAYATETGTPIATFGDCATHACAADFRCLRRKGHRVCLC
jgi:hypothetical protein